eukprot:TRINITY_DN1731_c1_g1_i1.p1 TRINITY_DN1731_c1_g1~~TRINITY_DN1731_c1_g1_i1.p1  ORF type:complete len:139 (+),score=14.49 TRINITY_DN1731_c1_g1_i1:72-488(+)
MVSFVCGAAPFRLILVVRLFDSSVLGERLDDTIYQPVDHTNNHTIASTASFLDGDETPALAAADTPHGGESQYPPKRRPIGLLDESEEVSSSALHRHRNRLGDGEGFHGEFEGHFDGHFAGDFHGNMDGHFEGEFADR